MNKFQVFGSPDSLDHDVCFFVDTLGSIEENKRQLHQLIKSYSQVTTKKVNGNLARIKNGVVEACFKGSIDELNNALYYTYIHHDQQYDQIIERTVIRNSRAKIERCNRTLISAFTRTHRRAEAKLALRKPVDEQLDFIRSIRLKTHTDFGKNGSLQSVYKSIAFQIGQTRGLFAGKEYYTKGEISQAFPELSPYLYRENVAVDALEIQLAAYCAATENYFLTHK